MFGPCLANEYPVNFKSSVVVYLNGTWRDLQRGKRIFERATVRFIRLHSNWCSDSHLLNLTCIPKQFICFLLKVMNNKHEMFCMEPGCFSVADAETQPDPAGLLWNACAELYHSSCPPQALEPGTALSVSNTGHWEAPCWCLCRGELIQLS